MSRRLQVAPGGPVVFEVIQEADDQFGVEVGDVELGRLFAGGLLRVAEQEPEAVPVAGDGVGADPALDQPAGEEAFHDRGEAGHRWSSPARSSRAATTPINSGVASKYQYVQAGLRWPR